MNLYSFKAKLITLFSVMLLFCAISKANITSRITIQKDNISLQDALFEIEKQSQLSVAYNQSLLSGKTKSLNIQNLSVEDALNMILSETGFEYKIKGEYVLVTPAENKQIDKKTISGKVADEQGEPLIGVNVTVQGSSVGTVTNLDGEFTLNVSNGDILNLSYIGYKAMQVPVSGDRKSVE